MNRKVFALVLAVSFAVSACGSDETEGTGGNAGNEEVPMCAPELLDCGSAEPVEAAGSNAAPESSSDYTVQDYLVYMISDIDTMWSEWFTTNGFSEPMVGYEIINPGETYTSVCAIGGQTTFDSAYPNAFYCPGDVLTGGDGVNYQGVVVLPETTFQKMWEGNIFEMQSASVGDFAAAIITAHEFGHHIQDEMLLQLKAADPAGSYGPPNGKNQELIADCFAGVWMNSAYYQNMLIDTDYEEALNALSAIGDQGDSADPHGTPEERAAAVTAGYNSGQPVSCIDSYWQ